ncbi:MAG: NAD-dependent malic enzyme [Vicinamibacterales bacterium]
MSVAVAKGVLGARGTACSWADRLRLGLDGLLPPRVETLDEQVARVMSNVRAIAPPLGRYRYLRALQHDNDTLYYRVLMDHMAELLPVVYTPTVGEACRHWSRIYERPAGMYVSARRHAGRIERVLRNWPHDGVRMIVVTDGGRILGLGDLGANGMGIPIGKLVLYSLCAGVPPDGCLPVALDVGTDTAAVRHDPFYLGDRAARLTGADYSAFLDEFVAAVERTFPRAVLQFEDFNTACAFGLLERYRDRFCCFNDDVQGTGAMVLAGLLAAGRMLGTPLTGQRLLFVGSGEAGIGAGRAVVAALRREGMAEDEARHSCLFVDSCGTVVRTRADLARHKQPFAQDLAPDTDLVRAIEAFGPTALIGASGCGGRFTREVLDAMARQTPRPVILALSNPTANAECTARQAYEWTDGRAVFASGSPFEPVSLDGRTFTPAQANNASVFPGVGLGLLVSGARRVSDEMFLAAAHALADQTTQDDLAAGRLFPPAARLREVAVAVAAAVAHVAWDSGLAGGPKPADPTEAIRGAMYSPHYD